MPICVLQWTTIFFRFAMSNAKFSYVDNHLASFRVHDQSKTMSLPYKFWKEEFEVYYRISGGRLFSDFITGNSEELLAI